MNVAQVFLIFKIVFSQEPPCGSRITEGNGVLQTENYPLRYPNNVQCSWVIGGSPTDIVTLTAESFNVEPAQGCRFDYLEVQTAQFTERFCGRTSSGFGLDRTGRLEVQGSVQLIFVSDNGDQYLGFRIQYQIASAAIGCASEPCQNGGFCLDLGPGEIECFCDDGFSGQFCEVGNNRGPCDANPCRNEATCTQTGTGTDDFTCRCVPGFVGRICSINEDNCRINLCENGGTCIDGLNNFDCVCTPGFSGPLCQVQTDPCDPCQNGGACDSRGGEFFCICNGFTGRLCENPETPDNNNEPRPGQRQPSNENQSPDDENDSLVILEIAEKPDQQKEQQNRVGLYLAITGASFACVAGAVGVGTFIHKKKQMERLRNTVTPMKISLPNKVEDLENPPSATVRPHPIKEQNIMLNNKVSPTPYQKIDFRQFSEHL